MPDINYIEILNYKPVDVGYCFVNKLMKCLLCKETNEHFIYHKGKYIKVFSLKFTFVLCCLLWHLPINHVSTCLRYFDIT